ncbi:30S ribosomal protein S2 [Candidatus Dojkabacteria bacterium]|nr:30S ribosomal protein S2 [Candidatus Dojkabacteria bacterium]
MTTKKKSSVKKSPPKKAEKKVTTVTKASVTKKTVKKSVAEAKKTPKSPEKKVSTKKDTSKIGAVSQTGKTIEKVEQKETSLIAKLPEIQELLKAGVQFGHKAKRLNPKMEDYIYSKRWDIHIIDVNKTLELLEKALNFLTQASKEGDILFVGTKRQAVDIIQSEAMRAGAHFIVNRWPGGLLTNFELIKKSLKKLLDIENQFESGVEGKTKYEVSRMKKGWERLNRLYGGIKTMQQLPRAVVIVDSNFEKVALTETRRLGIPVVSIVDTNSNPEVVDYPVPGNDDALASIGLFAKCFADAVIEGNEGKGVKHDVRDYNVTEVKIKRKSDERKAEEEAEEEKEAAVKDTVKKTD